MQPTSEGIVILNRLHNGPGTMIHRAERSGFLTLTCTPATTIESADEFEMPVQSATVRIRINKRDIILHKTVCDTCKVCQDVWIHKDEEVWASISVGNKYGIFGSVV